MMTSASPTTTDAATGPRHADRVRQCLPPGTVKPARWSRSAGTLLRMIGLLLLVAVSCDGCVWRRDVVPVPSPVRRVPAFTPLQYRRLAVLDPQNLTDFVQAGDIVRDCLATELQGTGRFEVLSRLELPAPESCPDTPLAYPDVLPVVMERYHPDAILICTVTEYRPYAPMRLGLSLRVISATDATTLAAVDSSWESPLNDDEGRPSGNPVLTDFPYAPPDLALYAHSPREFVRNVAREIAVGLAWTPPVMLPPPEGAAPPGPTTPALEPPSLPPPVTTGSDSSTLPASGL